MIDAYKVLDWGEVKEQEGTEDARKLMVGREFEEVEMESGWLSISEWFDCYFGN